MPCRRAGARPALLASLALGVQLRSATAGKILHRQHPAFELTLHAGGAASISGDTGVANDTSVSSGLAQVQGTTTPPQIWPHQATDALVTTSRAAGAQHHADSKKDHGGHLEAEVPATLEDHQLEGHGVLDSNHGIAKHVLMPAWGGFLICMLVGAAFGQFRPIAAIPMSAWTIAVSATGGLMLRAMLANNVISDDWYMKTSSTFLNLGLLPIIIFASGWSLNHLNFISQLEHIAIFAVFGTLIAFIFTGGAMCTLGAYEFHMIDDVRSNFVFAALISAVDPVATLSTLAKLGLDMSQPLLHTMIFGESVVNDAVAIVLFKAINHGSGHLEAHAVAYDIAKLLFGSWAFGHVAACGLIFLMRCARLPGNTVPETLYIVGSAWFIFALAEGFELSGIIANLWAGTIFKMYGSQLLEEEGIELTSHFLEVAAEMSDTMVFMLCGVSSALVTSFRAIWFATFSCFVCLFGRGLSTSVCAVISNGVKRSTGAPENHQLHFAHQFMMWHAGLRGGIALVLALEVDASWCHYKATIINTTFLIICLYLLAFGSTTELMLRKFGFSKAPTFEEEDPTSPSFGTHGPSPTGAKSHSAAASPSSARSEGGKIEHKGSSAEEDAQLWQEVQQGEPSLKIRWVKASNEFHEMILVGDRGMLLRKRKAAQKHWHQLQQHARKPAPAQNIGADAEAALPPIPQYKSTPNAFGGRSGRQLSSTPGV